MKLDNKDIEFGFWSIKRRNPLFLNFDDDRIYEKKCLGIGFYDYNKKSKEIKEWNKKLRQLDNVQYLWTHHKLNQDTFEMITQMKNLRGINIKWSSLKDISAIKDLSGLQHLNLGLSSSVESIEPIGAMNSLLTFESENLQKVKDWNPISGLNQLEGLGIGGNMYKTLKLESIEFLRNLVNLRYLFLISTRIANKSLKPIEGLGKLECIRIAGKWDDSEFKRLRNLLPKLKYGNVANDDLTVQLNKIFEQKKK